MKQEYPELLEDDDFHSDDQAGLVVCPHSIEEQTELILTKIKAAIDAHDTGFENVFNTDYFLTDRALWPACFRTMKKWMDEECPEFFERPTPSVLSIVHGLDHPDMLIEFRMWATLPEQRGGEKRSPGGSRSAAAGTPRRGRASRQRRAIASRSQLVRSFVAGLHVISIAAGPGATRTAPLAHPAERQILDPADGRGDSRCGGSANVLGAALAGA